MLWGANIDEVHDVEVIIRTVSGGAGAMLWNYAPNGKPSNDCRIGFDGKTMPAGAGVAPCPSGKPTSTLRNGLNSSLAEMVESPGCPPTAETCDASANLGWREIDAFIRSLRLPRPPAHLDSTRIAEGRKIFQNAGCASCHGGRQWTVSTLFYTPSDQQNGKALAKPPAMLTPAELELALGRLRLDQYSVPMGLAALNPAARATDACPAGVACATFRVPPESTTATQNAEAAARKLLYGEGLVAGSVDVAADAAKLAGSDQLRCALRSVGTFPTLPADLANFDYYGVAPGEPKPQEYRADMTLAQGKDGFGVPSLFGLALGAPFFHAGNARTLEEMFDETFAMHHSNPAIAVASDFPSGESERDYLIEFLLSLSEDTEIEPVPAEMDFCRQRPPTP